MKSNDGNSGSFEKSTIAAVRVCIGLTFTLATRLCTDLIFQRDVCIKTRILLPHWFAWQASVGTLDIAHTYRAAVPSAGSLAVILQPAFLPFGVEWLISVVAYAV